MKLFYYDSKHGTILDSLDLGELSVKEQKLIADVLEFADKNLITDGRYSNLCIANNVELVYNEDGEREIILT